MSSVHIEIAKQTTINLVPSSQCFENLCWCFNSYNLNCVYLLNNKSISSKNVIAVVDMDNNFGMKNKEIPIEMVWRNIINDKKGGELSTAMQIN